MAMTNAQKQRAMRQDGLRDFLSKQKLIEKVIDDINEIKELDVSDELFDKKLTKLKTACDQRHQLIRKYLPDLKSTELTGEGGGPVEVSTPVQFVAPSEE